MIIERRLKYIKFHWDDDTQVFTIRTFANPNIRLKTRAVPVTEEGRRVIGQITLNKVYLFSTMRFMVRIAQRMWGRKIPRKKKS